MFALIIIGIIIFGSPLSLVIYEIVRRQGKCSKCEKPVKLTFTNTTPGGPNPLKLYLVTSLSLQGVF